MKTDTSSPSYLYNCKGQRNPQPFVDALIEVSCSLSTQKFSISQQLALLRLAKPTCSFSRIDLYQQQLPIEQSQHQAPCRIHIHRASIIILPTEEVGTLKKCEHRSPVSCIDPSLARKFSCSWSQKFPSFCRWDSTISSSIPCCNSSAPCCIQLILILAIIHALAFLFASGCW